MMREDRDALHEILRLFVEAEVPAEVSGELKERLERYRDSQAYAHAKSANRENPGHASRYGRYETAEILWLCVEERYKDAWRRFKSLEEYLRERGWMELFNGDLYRLGARIARLAGEGLEAERLEEAYRDYRARYVDSFGARVVAAMRYLWGTPEVLEELEEDLAPGAVEIEEGVRELGELLTRGAPEAVRATAPVLCFLLEVWEDARKLFARTVSVSDVVPVPVVVGAFSGEQRERFRVQAVGEDGRLTVVAWETDEGELRVDVQTPRAEDGGRTVRVVLLGEGEPVVADITLEQYVFEGQPYGSVGRQVVGPFAEQAERLGRECAVVAAFLEEGEREHGQ